MKDVAAVIASVILLFIVLPVLLLWLRDRLCNRWPSPSEIEEINRRFKERRLNPDFATIEAHFNHRFPEALRQLYNNKEEILRHDFEVIAPESATPPSCWYIAYYQPADMENICDAWPGREAFYPFADDGGGNGYLVDPTLSDPPVLFHDHDTGELVRVAERASEFLKWPKRAVEHG